MQSMQMRMKLPLKHDIRYAQHFAKMNSEHCQASEVELFVKTVNDLKLLKAVIAKRSTLVIWRGSGLRLRIKSYSRDSSQDLLAQIVAMKAYFMNETYELKNEMFFKKSEDGEKNSDSISIIKFYKSEISLLKDQNSFLKSEEN